MIDRENFDYINNIVGVKQEYNLKSLYDILSVIKNDPEKLSSVLIDNSQTLEILQKNHDTILKAYKHNDFVTFYISVIELIDQDIDTELLYNVLKTIKQSPESEKTILDSFSNNQLKAKKALLENLSSYINKDASIAILGCWYGSVLVPNLASNVKQIIAIDLDDLVVRTGKNRFFKFLINVDWSCGDVFTKELNYAQADIVINTSCEHMKPMNEWKFWKQGMVFACQSNDMYDIPTHVNCVSSIEEFKSQLPTNSKILNQEEIKDSRGTRYMIIGQIT